MSALKKNQLVFKVECRVLLVSPYLPICLVLIIVLFASIVCSIVDDDSDGDDGNSALYTGCPNRSGDCC